MSGTDTGYIGDTNTRYPARVREVALQVWGFQCGRSVDCTRDALLVYAADEGWPSVPDAHTLRLWARRDNWAGEVARVLRSIAPDMAARAVVDLITAAMDGAAYAREVASGRIAKPNVGRSVNGWNAIKAVGLDALARAELLSSVGQSVYGMDALTPVPTEAAVSASASPNAAPISESGTDTPSVIMAELVKRRASDS